MRSFLSLFKKKKKNNKNKGNKGNKCDHATKTDHHHHHHHMTQRTHLYKESPWLPKGHYDGQRRHSIHDVAVGYSQELQHKLPLPAARRPRSSSAHPHSKSTNSDHDHVIESGPTEHPSTYWQVASDLHIEMITENTSLSPHEREALLSSMIKPSAPYLLLAGDIGVVGTMRGRAHYRAFLQRQSEQFQHVLVIAGNHEFYSKGDVTVSEVLDIMESYGASLRNVTFLHRSTVTLGNTRVIGATLWSDIAREKERMIASSISDFQHMYVWPDLQYDRGKSLNGGGVCITIDDVRFWHHIDVAFIQRQLREAETLGEKVIVMTHHAPMLTGTSHPRFQGGPLQSAFATDLSNLFHNHPTSLKAWVFGHTHYCCDQKVGEHGARLIANQRDYYWSTSQDYKNDFVFSL